MNKPLTVTKLDGSLQKFDLGKILRWEIWSCEGFKDYVKWKDIILKVKEKLYDKISTQEIQKLLIEECNNNLTWYHSLAAGRLYAAMFSKQIYSGDGLQKPTIYDLHQKLVDLGLMVKLNYTKEEYAEIEKFIDHTRDFNYAYFQYYHIVHKYGISNRVTKKRYETPQFTFMRMAMALAENMPDKLTHVKNYYNLFSKLKFSAPTPNFVNLGTNLNGFISCCLYKTDDTAESLAIGDLISFTMTYMSAGIGSFIDCRSLNDPVKGGIISHIGKIPLYKSLKGSVEAMLQGSRGGAATSYFTCFDPEIVDIIHLQNPRTPPSKQVRGIHFAMIFNRFFTEKVLKNEDIFTFNCFTAPDLHNAFFSKNEEEFRRLYEKYEKDSNFKKNYLNARNIALQALRQAHEVGTLYFININETNIHTSFKETIYQSNLCLEVVQPTKAYKKVADLYREDLHEDGEISLCALGGICLPYIESDKEYEEACYYALNMIDIALEKNNYAFPHLKRTALARRNAAVCIVGLAYDLAKKGYNYTSKESLTYIHRVAEKHMYHLIKASLRLAKEKGLPEWYYKSKYSEGWLPIDTYNKNVDKYLSELGVDTSLQYDWELLRKEVLEFGGLRNNVLCAFQPTESSSKAMGLPNSIYPIKKTKLKKTDSSLSIDFIVTESDILEDKYQLCWDLSIKEQYIFYSIFQKFCDQAISADVYIDRAKEKELKATRLLEELYWMTELGVKTRYYTHSLTLDDKKLEDIDIGCSGGSCTL